MLLKLHNDVRQQGHKCSFQISKKSPPLQWNQTLADIAHSHTLDMHRRQKLSHKDSSGLSLGERLDQSGYAWQAYAENIAFGVDSEQGVLDLWLKSRQHCKNVMNNAYTEMGGAYVDGYWTAIYARSK